MLWVSTVILQQQEEHQDRHHVVFRWRLQVPPRENHRRNHLPGAYGHRRVVLLDPPRAAHHHQHPQRVSTCSILRLGVGLETRETGGSP